MKVTLIVVCAVLATAMAGAVSLESRARDVDAAGGDVLAAGKDVVGKADVVKKGEGLLAVARGSVREGVLRTTAYSGTLKDRASKLRTENLLGNNKPVVSLVE